MFKYLPPRMNPILPMNDVMSLFSSSKNMLFILAIITITSIYLIYRLSKDE